MVRSSLIPGFRFHPTDVELVMFYLKRKLVKKKIAVNAIAEVNIYDFSPWDLPDKSALKSGDLEWYFFCPKARKYSSGRRSNRATDTGFWKATGKDRHVNYNGRTVATIKTLVFHTRNAGKGERTDWVMHEYKMEDEHLADAGIVQDLYVLCKVFEKSGSGPKNGAQYGAPFNEEDWDDDLVSCLDSQVVVGLVGASNTMDHKQKGPAITNMTEPCSSIVTFSANRSTDTLNDKQKVAAAMNMGGTHSLSVTEPGSSSATLSAHEMHLDLPANDDVMSFKDFNLIMESKEVEAANDDVMFLEDIDLIMESEEKVKNMVPNEEDDIYGDLVNLVDLSELNKTNFNTDGVYILELFTLDELDTDLGEFYVD